MRETKPRRLWHGGAPGRAVGDELLPPSSTGLEFTRRHISEQEGMKNIVQRLDRVYVTSDRAFARVWAGIWTIDGAKHGGGTLYQVEVEPGLLEPDDDLLELPGLSFQAPHAVVTAIYDPYVAYDVKYVWKLKVVLDKLAELKRQ